MKLYWKVFQFLKPFWKLIIISILLTFCDVFFNNLSLWVTVDLIQELFSPQQQTAIVSDKAAAGDPETGIRKKESKDGIGLPGLPSVNIGLYQKVNQSIKKLIIFKEDRFKTLKVVCILIFLSFFLKNITDYARRLIISFIQLKIIVNIRNRLHNAIVRLSMPVFFRHNSGEMISIAFNDVTAVQNVLNNSIGNLIIIPVQVLLNLIILLLISWKLTLFTFLVIPVSGYLIVQIGKSIRRKSRKVYMRISEVVSIFQEMVNSIRIVKAFTNESFEERKFREANDQFFKVQFRSQKLQLATSPINETLGTLILVFLLWYGGNMVYQGTGLKSEDFIRFLVFLYALFKPLKELSGLNNVLQTGMAAAERIFMIIDSEKEDLEDPRAKRMTGFRKSIVFENVDFRYPSHDRTVLSRIDLTVKKGKTVALVGHSGSGKTTLINLIPRFFEPVSGRILLDGTELGRYRLTDLRKHIGIVTQESILFNDTVRMNIGYGSEGSTEKQIIAAARAANAWEFIEKMEKGLDTEIGEHGLKVSGGQKQRIAIARAILKNPPILILDEATSSLDTESERLVQDAIEHLMKNRTVIAIAHRLSTVIDADTIVVLRHGQIIDSGSHRKLLKTCPTYSKLYKIQFQDGEGN